MTALTDRLFAQVTWAGLELMITDDAELSAVVTNLDGWYGTPDVNTNDVERTLGDGTLYGPKTAKGKEITISGVVVGERNRMMEFRSLLAQRAAAVLPSDLLVNDPWIDRATSAVVRASTAMSYATMGGAQGFRYEVTVTAADPHRYSLDWSREVITLAGQPDTGRIYPRSYTWHYRGTDVPGIALLTNLGDLPAPVQAVYEGPLSETFLTDGHNTIHLAPVADGVQILVSTATLTAQAPGGAPRGSYLLPGSSPLLVPPETTVAWRLAGTGTGTVTLWWRSTYA